MANDLVMPAGPAGAALYASMSPSAAKWLLPDGSIVSMLPALGGAGVLGAEKRPVFYTATCETAPAIVQKNLTDLPEGYEPFAGDIIMVRFTGGTNTAAACVFTIADDETVYPILFNGLATNTTAGAWKLNGVFPFYFDGESFNQLCYAKETDSNTTYAAMFEFNVPAMKITVNPNRAIDRYQLVLERADGTFDKTFTVAYSTSKTKAVNTATDFKVDGLMWYYATTAALAINAVVTGTTNYRTQTHQATNFVNYSLNGADQLTPYKWVYLVGIPQADPMVFRLDPASATSWYTTNKPTTEDGKIYIRLGYYSDGTIFSLFAEHPAYWFKNGLFRPYLTT